MHEAPLAPWPLLVLARLYGAAEKGATMSILRGAFKPWLQETRAAEQEEALALVLEGLEGRGLCAVETKGKTRRWRITAAGGAAARRALRLPESNRAPTWASLLAGPITAAALGVAPETEVERKRIASAPGLRAAVLRKSHALPVRDLPTAREAADALLWQQLGVETNRPFTMEAVKRFLLSKALGQETGALSAAKLLTVAAGKAAGARRNDPRAMREAILERWLASDNRAESPAPEPDVLDAFAARALDAAKRTVTGRFGSYLVFIHHVHATYLATAYNAPCSLETFKNQLVEAHRRGLLELDRADLVPVMPQHDVANSETRYLNSVFHFIRLPEGVQ